MSSTECCQNTAAATGEEQHECANPESTSPTGEAQPATDATAAAEPAQEAAPAVAAADQPAAEASE